MGFLIGECCQYGDTCQGFMDFDQECCWVFCIVELILNQLCFCIFTDSEVNYILLFIFIGFFLLIILLFFF